MRLAALTSSLLLLLSTVFAEPGTGSGGGGLYPPGLMPLINRANVLLSTGQFNEAAKLYTEAIEQSPADYLLYYKRATAYFSLSRHAPALDDFDRVLSLSSASKSFDSAHLMKARIHLKEGQFRDAHEALRLFTSSSSSVKKGDEAAEVQAEIAEGEKLEKKAFGERKAMLWNACVETASAALRIASHSVELRQARAECALAAGDLESAAGDLTRLSHLLPPSTPLLVRIFRLTYFFLPVSPAAMNTLKQCLHYDPDSKPCLSLHRIVKALDKSFASLEGSINSEDWKGVLRVLTGSNKNNDLMNRFDEALKENTRLEDVFPESEGLTHDGKQKQKQSVAFPDPMKSSPRRQLLVRAMCKAHTRLGEVKKAARWCETLLAMDGCEEDVDGLVGKAEGLMAEEEWEGAVRLLEKAFEASGRGDREIHQKLQKAQRLLKQSKRKDYYKVLGVARDADQRTIKKAFRRAAMKSHPDKGGTEEKMAAVNEAYEVLSNPELRARFDNGEDPNDPLASQGGHPFAAGGGHPFAQFFQQSGGGFPGGFPGGGHFQFHFGH